MYISFSGRQGWKILKASLQSKTVLSDVFLSKEEKDIGGARSSVRAGLMDLFST